LNDQIEMRDEEKNWYYFCISLDWLIEKKSIKDWLYDRKNATKDWLVGQKKLPLKIDCWLKLIMLIKLVIRVLKMDSTSFWFMSSVMSGSQNNLYLESCSIMVPRLVNMPSIPFAPFSLLLLLLTSLRHREILFCEHQCWCPIK
jgi:hypothetical protein